MKNIMKYNDIIHAEPISRFKIGYHNLLLEHVQIS